MELSLSHVMNTGTAISMKTYHTVAWDSKLQSFSGGSSSDPVSEHTGPYGLLLLPATEKALRILKAQSPQRRRAMKQRSGHNFKHLSLKRLLLSRWKCC